MQRASPRNIQEFVVSEVVNYTKQRDEELERMKKENENLKEKIDVYYKIIKTVL